MTSGSGAQRPILEAVISRLDDGESAVWDHIVRHDTGMKEGDVRVGLGNLHQAGLITGRYNPATDG